MLWVLSYAAHSRGHEFETYKGQGHVLFKSGIMCLLGLIVSAELKVKMDTYAFDLRYYIWQSSEIYSGYSPTFAMEIV